MEYEKLHKDTITKLQQMVDSGKITVETARNICADFVPENENERIRKALIHFISEQDGFLTAINGISVKDITAWLEKQREFKSIDSDDLAILEIWENAIKENKEKWQLSDWFIEATSLLIQKVKCIENNENINIKDSGVMLNACINALRTVGHSHLSDWLEKQRDKKPTWSEEDMAMLDSAIAFVERSAFTTIGKGKSSVVAWLKSLKDRYTWNPSNEQMETCETPSNSIKKIMPILKFFYQDLEKPMEE